MTPWTHSPRARSLLSEAAANPPATRPVATGFGDYRDQYTGRIARDLRKLWRDALDEALQAGDASGDHTEYRAIADLTPEVAIERVVAAKSDERKAA